jgi:very-short-patch-repair endonuclease
MGFTPKAIEHWIQVGYFNPVYPGVYAVGHPDLSRHGHFMAAVLACGDGALLSHVTAAVHWGLLRSAASRIDITVPSPRRVRAQHPIRIHRAGLHHDDYRLHEHIPVTGPARTLIDLADVVPANRIREAYEQSQRVGLFDRAELTALIARTNGRRGLKVIGRLLAEATDDPPELRSRLEREFLDLLRAAGIPLPATNVVVEGLVVDAYWPEHGLVVELDGYGYHHSREAFERDHERDEILANAGLAVRRFTHSRLHNHPESVMETMRTALANGPPS